MFQRSGSNDRGFTLIEVLAALSVFAVMTIGITPLLVSSIRGTALAQSHTVSKNIVSEAMERVRGLPFYDAATNRDLLDLYFPNRGAGYNSSGHTFTTSCTATTATPAANGARACPARHADGTPRLPAGFELVFVARFVKPSETTPETFTVVPPSDTYDTANEATSLPPTQLLEMTITAAWTEMGKLRQFSLSSVIGDRRLSTLKASATAAVDHVFNVTTAYDVDGTVSGMSGTGGSVTSEVEIKAVATAFSNASAGQMQLSKQQTETSDGEQLASISGAEATLRAPLNVSPAPVVSKDSSTISHPGLLGASIGHIGTSEANSTTPAAGVQVVGGFPKSTANVTTTAGVGTHYWATNQADTGELSAKKFDPTKRMFSVQRPQGPLPVHADSYAEATPTSPLSGRKVEATATGFGPQFVLLPVTFATGTGGVVVIDNFTATVNCKSTGSASGAAATGSWSASLRYWRDLDPNDGLAVGGYVAAITLSGDTSSSVTSDRLVAIRDENPLVYDDVVAANDVYLFSDPVTGKRGYLNSWSSTFAMESSKSANVSSVSMPYAINIVTAKTNSTNEESIFKVSIGKLSCRAEDNRE